MRILTLGRQIQSARERKNIGLTELAYRTGISVEHLMEIEGDQAYACDLTIRAFSRELGIPIEILNSLQVRLNAGEKAGCEQIPALAMLLKIIAGAHNPVSIAHELMPLAKDLARLQKQSQTTASREIVSNGPLPVF